MVRPSPNEEAYLLKQAREKLRKQRLLEVRAKSRVAAASIRQRVKDQKNAEKQALLRQLEEKFELDKAEQIAALEEMYEKSLKIIGQSHTDARNTTELHLDDMLEITREADSKRAAERFESALSKLRSDKLASQMEELHRRSHRACALSEEKSRAAHIASLPPPPNDPLKDLPLNNQKPVRTVDSSAFSHSHFHMPEQALVQRADPLNQSKDAFVAAESAEGSITANTLNKQLARSEQLEKARVRGQHALHKERIRQDYENILQDLSQLQKADRYRRAQNVQHVPHQVFAAPHRVVDERNEKQMQMENAFEDIFMKATDYRGDLHLVLQPEPEPDTPTASEQLELSSRDESTLTEQPTVVEVQAGDEDEEGSTRGSAEGAAISQLSPQAQRRKEIIEETKRSDDGVLSTLMSRIKEQREAQLKQCDQLRVQPAMPKLSDTVTSVTESLATTEMTSDVTASDVTDDKQTTDAASTVSARTSTDVQSTSYSTQPLTAATSETSLQQLPLHTFDDSSLSATTSHTEPLRHAVLRHPVETGNLLRQLAGSDRVSEASSDDGLGDQLRAAQAERQRQRQQSALMLQQAGQRARRIQEQKRVMEEKLRALEQKRKLMESIVSSSSVSPATRSRLSHVPEVDQSTSSRTAVSLTSHESYEPEVEFSRLRESLVRLNASSFSEAIRGLGSTGQAKTDTANTTGQARSVELNTTGLTKSDALNTTGQARSDAFNMTGSENTAMDASSVLSEPDVKRMIRAAQQKLLEKHAAGSGASASSQEHSLVDDQLSTGSDQKRNQEFGLLKSEIERCKQEVEAAIRKSERSMAMQQQQLSDSLRFSFSESSQSDRRDVQAGDYNISATESSSSGGLLPLVPEPDPQPYHMSLPGSDVTRHRQTNADLSQLDSQRREVLSQSLRRLMGDSVHGQTVHGHTDHRHTDDTSFPPLPEASPSRHEYSRHTDNSNTSFTSGGVASPNRHGYSRHTDNSNTSLTSGGVSSPNRQVSSQQSERLSSPSFADLPQLSSHPAGTPLTVPPAAVGQMAVPLGPPQQSFSGNDVSGAADDSWESCSDEEGVSRRQAELQQHLFEVQRNRAEILQRQQQTELRLQQYQQQLTQLSDMAAAHGDTPAAAAHSDMPAAAAHSDTPAATAHSDTPADSRAAGDSVAAVSYTEQLGYTDLELEAEKAAIMARHPPDDPDLSLGDLDLDDSAGIERVNEELLKMFKRGPPATRKALTLGAFEQHAPHELSTIQEVDTPLHSRLASPQKYASPATGVSSMRMTSPTVGVTSPERLESLAEHDEHDSTQQPEVSYESVDDQPMRDRNTASADVSAPIRESAGDDSFRPLIGSSQYMTPSAITTPQDPSVPGLVSGLSVHTDGGSFLDQSSQKPGGRVSFGPGEGSLIQAGGGTDISGLLPYTTGNRDSADWARELTQRTYVGGDTQTQLTLTQYTATPGTNRGTPGTAGDTPGLGETPDDLTQYTAGKSDSSGSELHQHTARDSGGSRDEITAGFELTQHTALSSVSSDRPLTQMTNSSSDEQTPHVTALTHADIQTSPDTPAGELTAPDQLRVQPIGSEAPGSDSSSGAVRVISPHYDVMSLHTARLNNPNPLAGLPTVCSRPASGPAGLRNSLLADLLSEMKLTASEARTDTQTDTQLDFKLSDALSARGGSDIMIEGQTDEYSEMDVASEMGVASDVGVSSEMGGASDVACRMSNWSGTEKISSLSVKIDEIMSRYDSLFKESEQHLDELKRSQQDTQAALTTDAQTTDTRSFTTVSSLATKLSEAHVTVEEPHDRKSCVEESRDLMEESAVTLVSLDESLSEQQTIAQYNGANLNSRLATSDSINSRLATSDIIDSRLATDPREISGGQELIERIQGHVELCVSREAGSGESDGVDSSHMTVSDESVELGGLESRIQAALHLSSETDSSGHTDKQQTQSEDVADEQDETSTASGAGGSLQEAFQRRKAALIKRSRDRVQLIKQKRAEQQHEQQEETNESKALPAAGGAEPDLRRTVAAWSRQKMSQQPTAPAVEIGAPPAFLTADDRKVAAKEMKARTARLIQGLEEVRLKKQREKKQNQAQTNRNKAAEFTKKLDEARKKRQK